MLSRKSILFFLLKKKFKKSKNENNKNKPNNIASESFKISKFKYLEIIMLFYFLAYKWKKVLALDEGKTQRKSL